MAVLLGSLQAADETRPESEMVTAGRHSKVRYGCNASGPFGSPRPCFHRFSFGYPLGFCICDGGWVAFVKTVAWSTTSLNHLPKYKHAYVHRLSPSAWRIPPLIGKKFWIDRIRILRRNGSRKHGDVCATCNTHVSLQYSISFVRLVWDRYETYKGTTTIAQATENKAGWQDLTADFKKRGGPCAPVQFP